MPCASLAAPASTPLVPFPATVAVPAAVKARPVVIAVPSTKLRPVGNRATVPMAGCCTPKEPPICFARSARVAATPQPPMSPGPPLAPRAARIQVVPPATPPRDHRHVHPARPASLLRGATPHAPLGQSLVVSTRAASPSTQSPPRLVPSARVATQPSLSVGTPLVPQMRTARPHQRGLPPEMWGIFFDQLVDLVPCHKQKKTWLFDKFLLFGPFL